MMIESTETLLLQYNKYSYTTRSGILNPPRNLTFSPWNRLGCTYGE